MLSLKSASNKRPWGTLRRAGTDRTRGRTLWRICSTSRLCGRSSAAAPDRTSSQSVTAGSNLCRTLGRSHIASRPSPPHAALTSARGADCMPQNPPATTASTPPETPLRTTAQAAWASGRGRPWPGGPKLRVHRKRAGSHQAKTHRRRPPHAPPATSSTAACGATRSPGHRSAGKSRTQQHLPQRPARSGARWRQSPRG